MEYTNEPLDRVVGNASARTQDAQDESLSIQLDDGAKSVEAELQAERDAIDPPPTQEELAANVVPEIDQGLEKALPELGTPSMYEGITEEELRLRGEAPLGEVARNMLAPPVLGAVGAVRNATQGFLDTVPTLEQGIHGLLEGVQSLGGPIALSMGRTQEEYDQFIETRPRTVVETLLASEIASSITPDIGDQDSVIRAFSKFIASFLITKRVTAAAGVTNAITGLGKSAGGTARTLGTLVNQRRAGDVVDVAARGSARIFDTSVTAGITDIWSLAEDENLVSFLHEMGMDEDWFSVLAYDADRSEFENRLANGVIAFGAGALIDPVIDVTRALATGRFSADGIAKAVEKLNKARAAADDVAPEGLIGADDFDFAALTTLGRDRRKSLLDFVGNPDDDVIVRAGSGSPSPLRYVSSLLDLEEDVVGEAAESVAGRAARASSLDEPLLGFNYSRIDTTDDIHRVISDVADGYGDELSEARGGVRRLDDVRADADSMNPFDTLRQVRSTNQIPDLNDAEALALREFHNSTAVTLERLARYYADNPDNPAAKVAFNKVLTIMRETQRIITADKASASRRLGAYRIDAVANARGAFLVSELGKLADQASGDALSFSVAKKLAEASKAGDSATISRFLQNIDDVGRLTRLGLQVQEAFNTAWYFSLLSRGATMFRATVGTGLMVGARLAETQAAFFIGKALGTNETRGLEALAGLTGMAHGFADAFRLPHLLKALSANPTGVDAALGRLNMGGVGEAVDGGVLRAFRTGKTTFGSTEINPKSLAGGFSEEVWGYNPSSNLGRVMRALDGLTSMPQRLLVSTDEMFKNMLYRMEGNQIAYRKAAQDLDAGKITQEEFSATYRQYQDAPGDAVEAVLQREAAVGTFTNRIQDSQIYSTIDSVSKYPIIGVLLSPFKATPYNVSVEGMKRSPFAPFMRKHFWGEIQSKDPKRVEMAWTRFLTGNAVMLSTIDALMQHDTVVRVHGKPTSPEGERDALSDIDQRKRLEILDYSIDVAHDPELGFERGGFTTIPFRGLEPVVFPLAAAAGFVELVRHDGYHNDDVSTIEFTQAVAAAIGSQILEQPSLTGIQDLVVMIADTQDKKKGLKPWAESLALSLTTPGLTTQAVPSYDEFYRTALTFMDRLRSRTPGLSNSLPMNHDVWGIPQTKKVNGWGSILMGSSAYRVASGDDIQPIDVWLTQTNNVIKGPSKASQTFRPDVRIPMLEHAEEFEEMKYMAGQGIHDPATYGPSHARISEGVFTEKPTNWTPVPGGLTANLNLLVQGQHPYMQDHFDRLTPGEDGGQFNYVQDAKNYYYAAAREGLLANPRYEKLREAVNEEVNRRLADPTMTPERAVRMQIPPAVLNAP